MKTINPSSASTKMLPKIMMNPLITIVSIDPAPVACVAKSETVYTTSSSAQCAISNARIRLYDIVLPSKRVKKSPPSKNLTTKLSSSLCSLGFCFSDLAIFLYIGFPATIMKNGITGKSIGPASHAAKSSWYVAIKYTPPM